MAYHRPRDLDGFLPHLSKSDTKFRQQLGADLLAFLAEPSNPMTCQDIGQLIDGLIPWMQSSNYKVSSNGIEIMTFLIDRLGHDFKPYLQTVFPAVIDRLGDAKDTVREKAQLLILKLLERNVLTPQALLERLTPGFTHKNAKIREETLRCLVNTLNEHGAQSVTLSKFIPQIVKLLSDPTSPVRDTAFITLVDLYKHVGEKLRIDLQKRNLVPPSRLPALLARFDEVRKAGDLLPTASTIMYNFNDEPDVAVMAKPAIPVKKAGLLGASKRVIVSAPAKSSSSSNSAGGVDEEVFSKLFDDVPTLQIFSIRDILDHMKTIQETVGDPNKEWNKRVECLKKLRALVKAGAANFDDFYVQLRSMEPPLEASIKDLRSQVVREACISIAYLAQQLGNKFEHTAECLMVSLINLIQNSAKVVATAGHVTVRFILQYIHNPRLIPIITNSLSYSKSKEIRKSCCEFIEQIMEHWNVHTLERHIGLLQDALKRGIADADPDARNLSRKAFVAFRERFPDHAEVLLQSLEPSYQRALKGELSMSNSSSTNSLSTAAVASRVPRQLRPVASISSKTDTGKKGFRSNSAIDLQAAQRAKARAQYAAMARQKIASGTASLQGEIAQQARPRRTPDSSVIQSPEQVGRRRSRSSGVSHSQPTSRSGSPSSRIHYLYNRSEESPRPRRLSSGIPRSTTGSRDTSREGSPTRGSSISRLRARTDRPPLSPASRPVMAQKILQQSREAENALADALCYDAPDGDNHRLHSPRKSLRSMDNPSDESETSSVCSERSFDSYRKTIDYSWNGSQQRLSSRDFWEPCRDIGEIIAMCRSTVWQERKDGLISLRHYLESGAVLLPQELKQLTDMFTKMFMDSHTKSLSVFIDSLNILIKVHKNDLHDWLYVLLQRIFHKLGTDLLNSVIAKLLNTLEIIRKSFPVSLQFSCICRFLVDSTQTPNTKTKVAALSFLTSLCHTCEQTQFLPKSPTLQALQKIIMFSQDMKSPEIRNAARNCVVAVWNWNTPQITMLLSELPKEQQDIASHIVHNHLRKSSSGSEAASPMIGNSPKTSSPITPTGRGDDMNHEDVYRSLRRTTAEIQNYNYESLDRTRVTTSQDSGISQMSIGCDIRNDVAALEERIEELKISPDFAVSNESHSLPCTVNGVNEKITNGFNSLELGDRELVERIIVTCTVDSPTPDSEKQKLLSQLIILLNSGNTEIIKQMFKKLLRILLDNVNWKNKNYSIQVLVLQIFSEIFKNKEFKPYWSQFVELLTLRILEAHCSEKREVVKMAETAAASMNVFPFNTVVNVLSPLIQTGIGPTLTGAIKMLTKLVETNPDQVTDEHLEKIMPGLIKANDHEESAIRKCAVFCMVALHKAVGEERLAPYIACLPGSKVKLLRVYITKAQSSSVPTSPKISSANPSAPAPNNNSDTANGRS
ncbi:CLIP-associating protein isoform X2 [Agrilus planipennis]|uniref:CLIP-associating protein isoform X2 n=1 Tax=Agrilus planipennis TaxID=224129 RepID=A0A7F5R2D9_AGRPL|nr:CLIP-associating protein isoform X2 [Agrilus planipennis]